MLCSQLNRVGSSDHNAVLCTLGLNPAQEEDSQRTIWLWERADWQAIKETLAATDWDATFSADVNHTVDAFTNILLSAQTQHVPHRTYQTEPRDQPWFGYRCRLAAAEKYKAWTRYKRRPSRHNKALHRAACKSMSRTAKWARERWESNLRRKLSSNLVDPKQWWSIVKQRQGIATQERIPPLKTRAGSLAVTNQAKADLLAEHFSSKMTTEEPNREPPHLLPLCDTRLDSLVVRENIVARLLRDLNTRKAPGPDGVSPFLLKRCAGELSNPLTRIFQQCLNSSTWPSAWKEARVTPVHKKKDKGDPSNYRPISLLSVVSKTLERVIAEQLTSHLEGHHLISSRQHGFRKGRSASDLLLLLAKTWHEALDSGRPSLVISFHQLYCGDKIQNRGRIVPPQRD